MCLLYIGNQLKSKMLECRTYAIDAHPFGAMACILILRYRLGSQSVIHKRVMHTQKPVFARCGAFNSVKLSSNTCQVKLKKWQQ